MNQGTEITIEFSEKQQTEIMQKCGFVPKPIVTNELSLTMLSLAATAKNSEFLPLVNRVSVCNQIIDDSQMKDSIPSNFIVNLELTDEQRSIIKSIVNKDWQMVAIVPDDYDINFKEIWNTHSTAQKIGKTFLIVREKEKYKALQNHIVIKLPPVENNNTTFGTGNHPTTQIVLTLLEKYIKPNAKVLDIGTGSGILSAAAAKLGAEKIIAADINPIAVETAKATAKLNNIIEKTEFRVGGIEVIDDTYELVLANLFPKIIISIANELANKVAPDGMILLSGLVSARIPDIVRVMEKAGLAYVESITIDFWGGIALKKN